MTPANPPADAGGVSTLIAFLLDETGSMMPVRDATISGFNEYVQTVQRAYPDALLTLMLFSTERYSGPYRMTPLRYIAPLTTQNYQPSGGTPLYDCIARLIADTEKAAASMRPAPVVLCVIMTDGEENSSHDYNRDRIFARIREKEDEGWTFVYLGANQDAWDVGASIGVQASRAMTFDADNEGVQEVLRVSADASVRHLFVSHASRATMPPDRAPARTNHDFFTTQDASRLGKRPPKGPERKA